MFRTSFRVLALATLLLGLGSLLPLASNRVAAQGVRLPSSTRPVFNPQLAPLPRYVPDPSNRNSLTRPPLRPGNFQAPQLFLGGNTQAQGGGWGGGGLGGGGLGGGGLGGGGLGGFGGGGLGGGGLGGFGGGGLGG